MFRRKEEGLFDNAIDANTEENTLSTDSESNTGAGSAPAASAPAASSAAPTTGFGTSTTAAAAPAATGFNANAARPNAAATPPTANSFRPGSPAPADLTRGRLPETKPAAAANNAAASDKSKGGKRVLTVGNDILLKGEIATCDRLVIEGKVDATLNDVHTVEIAEGGSFKGSAQIEDAEISGLFEGDLTVRGRLVIYATGKVRGKISYGEIEIERGGELTGEIKIAGASSNVSRPANATKAA